MDNYKDCYEALLKIYNKCKKNCNSCPLNDDCSFKVAKHIAEVTLVNREIKNMDIEIKTPKDICNHVNSNKLIDCKSCKPRFQFWAYILNTYDRIKAEFKAVFRF